MTTGISMPHPPLHWTFLTACLFSNVALSDNYSATLPHSDLIIAILGTLVLVLVFIIFGLKKNHKQYQEAEEQLVLKHQDLERRLLDRSEKLHNLNSQLYDEIAKHEITEELLRETQDYIQNIINSMPSILIGVTRDGMITHWNTAARQATGINYDKALGFYLKDIAPELDISRDLIDRAIDLQKTQKREHRQQGHGSQAKFNDLTIYPLLSAEIQGAVIRIDDVTLRVRLETMMIQNEKMNSLGELAAGVAHEINNPLGTILQNIQNINRRISKSLPANRATAEELGISLSDLREYLKSRRIIDFLADIKDAGERATQIVKNMLEFSRADNKQFELVDLREIIHRSSELALHAMNAKQRKELGVTTVKKHFSDDCPLVRCSTIEIQQVILNLLSNAYQAFSETKQDKKLEITIRLHFTDMDAIITIEDNGPGMDEWTRRHIFDPFFTTKEVGKGTGLGLSVSYFIITEHHQGSITVDSTPEKGSTFTIHLPLENS
jgi:PAS domain S-box-containing protein